MTMMPRFRRIIQLFLLVLLAILIVILLSKSLQVVPRIREPLPASQHTHYPPPAQLLDLPDFQYLINPVVCKQGEDVLAVVLVHTHPSNVEVRKTIRNYLAAETLADIKLKRVFLVGQALYDQKNYPAVKQEVISEECNEHKDLIQGNFIEHYRNLTYKQVMGLTWAVNFCAQAEFIIKMDDDIAVDLFQIQQLLKYRYRKLNNELLGLIQIESHPLRTNESKWRVTLDEFSGKTYPPFLSGWCYLAPQKTISKIVSEIHKFPYFWIDDVFVTGIVAEKLGIERKGLNNKYTIHSAHLRCCSSEEYNKSRLYCDYIAGPTGGDTQLMAQALDQFSHCFRRGCQRRTGVHSIARKCVVTAEDNLAGKGVGEVIAL